MATTTDKALLDLRGWALGTWVGDLGKAIRAGSIHNAQRRKVAEMQALGWVTEADGSLSLSQAGREAIAKLQPSLMPKLTASQEELLEDVLRTGSVSVGLDYPPVVKLMAYGAVEPREQRMGGLLIVPTEMAREWVASREPEEVEAPAGPRP